MSDERELLPGSDRAYVKIEGDFSYDGWVKGLKAGRSFVTNGPILEFTPGEIIRLDGTFDLSGYLARPLVILALFQS